MLLVDEEEPRVRDRREGRRPRPDHGPRLPRAHAIPGVGALAFRERGVKNGGLVGKLARELPGENGRERDLRHQPDGAASRREGLADGPQVHLGLPAAGDSLEKRREVAPPADRGGDGGDRLGLRRRRREGRRRAVPRARLRTARLLEGAQQAPFSRGPEEPPERLRCGTGSPRGSPGARGRRESRGPPGLFGCARVPRPAPRRTGRPAVVRRLGRGSPPLRRGHRAHPPAFLEGAEGFPPFPALPGQVQDPHRLSSRQPRQDRALGRGRFASGERALLRDAVPHRPGGRQPGGKGALQDLPRRGEETLGHS